jgi:hypothetical protein
MTNLAFLFIYVAVSSYLNRWRGGSWPFLPTEVHGGPNDHKRTQVRRIVFAVGLGLLAWNPWVALVLLISCLTGWGYPVSAAIGVKKPVEPEFWPLDWICRPLSSISTTVYGVFWLCLHGFLFGAILTAITGSLWFLLWGLMGVAYWLVNDWEHGEFADGAVKGLAIGLYVLF